jgi:LytS/YehU family sensor histidine kinase
MHGVATRPGRSVIEVHVRSSGSVLHASVLNRSVGPAAAVQHVTGTGVGLRNTRARLEQHYGDAQSLVIEHSGDGARAAIELPLRRAS